MLQLSLEIGKSCIILIGHRTNVITSQPGIIMIRLPSLEIGCQSSTSSRLRKVTYPSICQLRKVQHRAKETPMLTCVGTIRKSHQSSKCLTMYYIKYCFIWSSFPFGMIPLRSYQRISFLRDVSCWNTYVYYPTSAKIALT